MYYFTFGWGHRHELNGEVFDKDCVVEIDAVDENEARAFMVYCFGDKWGHAYGTSPPDMKHFHRGVFPLAIPDHDIRCGDGTFWGSA